MGLLLGAATIYCYENPKWRNCKICRYCIYNIIYNHKSCVISCISCIHLPKTRRCLKIHDIQRNFAHQNWRHQKKETAKSGCTTHHIQSKTSLPFRIQSWERFKNRGVQKVSDRSQQVLMVDVCLTPRVIILTTQRNPKMITFMGDIQEGYGYIYSQPFLRIHYWYCKNESHTFFQN